MVSMRQGMPSSIRVMVIGETFASLASSDLLINKDSRIFFKEFFAMFSFMLTCIENMTSASQVDTSVYPILFVAIILDDYPDTVKQNYI